MAAERNICMDILGPLSQNRFGPPVSLEVAKRPVRQGLKSMVAARFDD